MSEPKTTRPLGDDADFLESLSELDRGLSGGSARRSRTESGSRRPPINPRSPASVQRPAPPDFPDWLAPSGVAAVSAASAAISEALDVPISALPAPAKSRASVEQSPVTEIRDAPQALREPEPLLERDSGFAFEPDLAPAPTSWRDRAVFALVIIVLMLAGASGAAWTFREPLRRAVTQWQSR